LAATTRPNDDAYALTPLAKADIFRSGHAAARNVDAADRVEQAIYDACSLMAEAPLRGHSRPTHSHPPALDAQPISQLRNRLRPETAPPVVAVLHGKRNLQQLLKEPVMARHRVTGTPPFEPNATVPKPRLLMTMWCGTPVSLVAEEPNSQTMLTPGTDRTADPPHPPWRDHRRLERRDANLADIFTR
jgi:plasmid stabilization system protein ParE